MKCCDVTKLPSFHCIYLGVTCDSVLYMTKQHNPYAL